MISSCFSLCYFLLYVYHFILDQIFVMMMIRATIFTVVFTLSFAAIFADDPCRFEYPGKGVIDLTTLGRRDGKATYADRISSTGDGYSILTLFDI